MSGLAQVYSDFQLFMVSLINLVGQHFQSSACLSAALTSLELDLA